MAAHLALVACVLLPILLLCGYWHLRRHFSLFERLSIPGTQPSLLVGNLREIMAKGQFQATLDWGEQHGRVFGYFEGYTPVLSVSDPHILREIVVKDANNFNHRKPFPLARRKALGLFLENGAQWHRSRSLLTPAFSAGKLKQMLPIMRSSADVLVDQLSKTLATPTPGAPLPDTTQGKTQEMEEREEKEEKEENEEEAREEAGREVDVYRVFQGLTLDVIGRCAFGLTTRAQTDPEDAFLLHIRRLFDAMAATPLLPLVMAFPFLSHFIFALKNVVSVLGVNPVVWLRLQLQHIIQLRKDMGPNSRVVDLVQLMLFPSSNGCAKDTHTVARTASQAAGAARTSSQAAGTARTSSQAAGAARTASQAAGTARTSSQTDGTARTTAPSGVAHPVGRQMTEREVVAQSMTFLLAGYETTSAVLAFLSRVLAEHPDVQTRLQEEVDTLRGKDLSYDCLNNLPYLDMVFDEVPPLPQRLTAAEGRVVRGVPIPAGMNVQANIWALHHDPRYWARPLHFDPDRYSAPNRRAIQPYTFLFSAPNRRAIQPYTFLFSAPNRRAIQPYTFLFSAPNRRAIQPYTFLFSAPNRRAIQPYTFLFSAPNRRAIQPYTFLPFGAGPRKCIGMKFAMMETKMTMVRLLQQYTLTISDPHQVPMELIGRGAIVPKNQVKVMVTKRDAQRHVTHRRG